MWYDNFIPNRKETGAVPTENEMKRMDLAMLYELRLILNESDKETYTKAELMELLDQIAITKK